MRKKKTNKINISSIVGKDAIKDYTSSLIPGIEFIVLNGLKILTTLIDDTFF
jgi:hypothetical protein